MLRQMVSAWREGWPIPRCYGHHPSPRPAPPPPIVRCELSMEKSTVLQSELKSCKELQDLEPENKCEALFPEILLLSGSLFLCLLGG